jgi:hypothetical protein
LAFPEDDEEGHNNPNGECWISCSIRDRWEWVVDQEENPTRP